MKTRAGYMVVGIFVLLSIAGILGFFLWLAKSDFDYKTNYYTIYFSGSVTGLTLGGPVSYLGVPVGTVKKIELEAHDLESVKITVAINESVPIREDAYASLELQGLTGYKFVQISGGSQTSPLLKAKSGERYPVIPSRYSGVEEILTVLPRMVNKLTNFADRLNSLFNEDNRTRISNALKNIDTLSQKLADSAVPLHDLIEDTRKAMGTFEKQLHVIGHSTETALTKVGTSADEFTNFIKSNRTALDALAQTGSYELLQTLNDTREMVTTATGLFEKLGENPRSLIFDTQRKGVSIPQ